MQYGSRHRFLYLGTACAVAALSGLLSGCALEKVTSVGSRDEVVDSIRNADLSARSVANDQSGTTKTSRPSSRPLLFPGSDSDPERPRDANPDFRTASAEPVVAIRGDGVEMNFEGVDIRTVAKTLLGDILKLNFVVDPSVQGNVTLATVGPIPRNDVLPAFESVLRISNAAIVHDHDLVKIVPVSEANWNANVSIGAGQPGFGISVARLRYTSAATVARTAENFLSRPGAIRVDNSRNLLLVQGTTSERQAVLDVISTFDVEWMRNQSVGVFPLKSTSPETMIQELDRIFQTSEGGVGQGVISFQPVARMNAVMVITKNPVLLKQSTQWVQRLDQSDTTDTTLRTYRLKYADAQQVAKILNDIFVGRGSDPTGDTPANQGAPGTTTAQSRIDSLDGGATSRGNTSSSGNSSQGSMGGASQGSGASTFAAAFAQFSDRKDTPDGLLSTPGGGSAARGGLFQNVRISADTANNSIAVYSSQEDYRAIERSLRELDRARLQVAIDATVAEVTLTDALQFGVQSFLTSSDAKLGQDNGSAGFFGAAQSATQSAFLQRVLPGFNLLLGSEAQPRVILSALSTLTSVRVLSSPSLVVLDNHPGFLQVGDEIPITTSSATVLTNSSTPVVNTIEMRNTGVILKVLPHVHSNGSIQLEVDQEISNVVNPNQTTLTPTISERRVHSTIVVTSGQTVLLGGLISEQDQKTQSGIPGLNQIKFLGDLFGNTSKTKQRAEIIIFIKPRLIRDSLDAKAVTEEFRERMNSTRGARSLVNGTGVATPAGPALSARK
jgi:general secretion pathway protein D